MTSGGERLVPVPVPVLGAYPAKRCPRRTHNDFDPAVPTPPPEPEWVEQRKVEGRNFEESVVVPLLVTTLGDRCVRIEYGDHRADKHRRIVETEAAMNTAVPVIIGAQLPDDALGGRTGSPDLLIRTTPDNVGGADARYLPADIKNHSTLRPAKRTTARISPIAAPSRLREASGWTSMSSHRVDDSVHLAHYTRMLQAIDRHPGESMPLAAVLGTTDFSAITGARYGLVWHDLGAPRVTTWSGSTDNGIRRRSLLGVYDYEFAFRQQIAAAARAGEPAMVRPFGKAECAECPYGKWCEDYVGPEDLSFAIKSGRLTDREWRYLYDHGLGTVEAMATSRYDDDLKRGFARYSLSRSRSGQRLEAVKRRAGMIYDGILLQPLHRGAAAHVPTADIEIDFDVEWHPADGHVYQWGARVRENQDDNTATYAHSAISFEPLYDTAAQALADDFFDWLERFVADHEAAGRSVLIYHWTSPEVTRTVRALGGERAQPLFERFVDLRVWMSQHYYARDGFSLKTIAPIFGFRWRSEDAGGGTSVLKIDQARDTTNPETAAAARDWLLTYNEDDCAAQAAIRDGLRHLGRTIAITEENRLTAPVRAVAHAQHEQSQPTGEAPEAEVGRRDNPDHGPMPIPGTGPTESVAKDAETDHDTDTDTDAVAESDSTASAWPTADGRLASRNRMSTSKPLSWNEIRENAVRFVAEWRGETRERAEAQSFWNDWFAMLGINRRRYVQFELKARRLSTGNVGFVDAFWEGQIAVEHKSEGKSLAEAEAQALDYLDSLTGVQQPRLIVTSDFARFRVLDLERNESVEFTLDELPNNIERFGFLAGYESRTFKPEDKVNIAAAEMMGDLYDALEETGYGGHDLKVFLVRVMFLLFADDTGLWEKGLFEEFLTTRTTEDGSDVGPLIERLFRVLDTPEPRHKTLDVMLARFPYVNGGLFRERIDIPDFDHALRDRLIECSAFDWSAISPAIFGSMFQSVMDTDARRELGAHYTSEANIMKVIGSLFLDELRAEFEAARNNARRLEALHARLGTLRFFDPAAGCGNFLITAYREIRALEFDILVRLSELRGDIEQHLDIATISQMSKVNVDQFYGIEYEEFPARIAETAIYLVDHLENMRLSKQFGQYFARIPLRAEAHMHIGNALDMDWNTVLPADQCTYLLGNPPFVGALLLNKEQAADRNRTFSSIPEAKDLRPGRLDYVMCWYAKAFVYLRNTNGRAAFVSTNSITQGEQARSLAPLMARMGYEIDFAHRTFQWSSEARGKAVVHVVIIGFSRGGQRAKKLLFDYPDIRREPVVTDAKHINAWLVDANDVIIAKRSAPLIGGLPVMTVGSQPTDGGHLIIAPNAYDLAMADLIAAKYVRRLIGADDMLNGKKRWCLWLTDAPPEDLRRSPFLKERIAAVAAKRADSPTEAFRKCPPHLFTHRKQPTTDWIAIPRHSSENRRIIPMAINSADDIAHDSLMMIKGADLWVFALLQSGMYTTWNRSVDGRIKSDLRISADISYNAFPFPDLNTTAKDRLTAAARAVLDARAAHPTSTLADLYDRAAMPLDLVRAHDALDRVVDGLYGFRKVPTEAERGTRLFQRYQELTAGLLAAAPKKRAAKSR